MQGISFNPNLLSGLGIVYKMIAFALAILWFPIYRTASEWIKTVQEKHLFEKSTYLINQIKIMTILTITSYLITFTKNTLDHMFWLIGVVTLLFAFALFVILSASSRFIEATSTPS